MTIELFTGVELEIEFPGIPTVVEPSPTSETLVVPIAGAQGTSPPDVRNYDFSKRGIFAGPYTSPLRRYVEKAGVLSEITVAVGAQPTGDPVVLDVLKNGVSIFPGGVGRPTIAPLSNVATVLADEGVVEGDFLQVAIISGAAADLTVAVTLEYLAEE